MPAFLFLFGVGLAAAAYGARPWGLILLWPAANALLLAVLYACNLPRGLCKRSRGGLSWGAWPAHAPFFLFRHAVAFAQIRFLPEPACQEVAPGLWIARRLRPGEIPQEVPRSFRRIVDLTAEFAEPRAIATEPGWRWIPILDAGVPTASSKRKLEALAREWGEAPGPMLIHCAQGHGRSAMAAAWLLVRTGRAASVDAALAQIQSVRPGAKVGRNQRRWLEKEFPAA